MSELDFQQISKQLTFVIVVWVRISAFLVFAPFFNAAKTSVIAFKTAFGLFFALLLIGALPVADWNLSPQPLFFVWILSGEILVGIMIALIMALLFFPLQLLGHILGFQMAFSMAQVIDSTMGEQSNILSVMLVMIGTVVFLTIGGDHLFLWGIKQSYLIIPPGKLVIGKGVIDTLSSLIIRAFDLGFRVASPAVILLLIVDLTLGLVGRTAAKMQIFFVGLPLKISIGLYLFIVTLGFIITVWKTEVSQIPFWLDQVFGYMKG